jgi:hypothetical protein
MAYVKPESALVQAADALLSRHTAGREGACASCGQPHPCSTARHAAEVRAAAGLAEAISGSFAQVTGSPGGGRPAVELSKPSATPVAVG